MRLHRWLFLGLLALPASGTAQAVKPADLVGAWKAELEHNDSAGKELGPRGWLVLWPDGLWWYGGALMWHGHGGARWRLAGDTLWLANDYIPYFHTMIDKRIMAIQQKGYGLAAMDTAVINHREPFPVPDSIYWSKDFRDSTRGCVGSIGTAQCGTWVYKVTKQGPRLQLVRLDSLSTATGSVATRGVLTRDTLLNCQWISGCD